MNNAELVSLIEKIICSEPFKGELEVFNNYFTNLKQEYLIRDAILKHLNQTHLPKDYMRAFAEYPRSNGRRIDLSINRKKDKPFLIEIKYQFSNDSAAFTREEEFKMLIDRDFNGKKTAFGKVDLFILIIACWNTEKKKHFFQEWLYDEQEVIGNSLNKYITKNKNWQANLDRVWKHFEDDAVLKKVKLIEIKEPYETTYHFFLLSRKEAIET